MTSNGLLRIASQSCMLSKQPKLGRISTHTFTRQFMVGHQCCAGGRKETSEEGPIRFTGSKAASWSMTNAKIAPKLDAPWYQPISVALSLGVFLFYFLFLREENDLDIELNYTLFERVPGMEENQLKVAIDYNRMYGKDTTELERRLAEIQQNKQPKQEQGSLQ
ncbi:hypothetical protein BaRGS_00014310 [Batillaria attramentaria]|uniref:Uncharacterized protein n=1 Tax=Batillaria attramentaria TaxID=370345 RepID=A0ABD0L5D5_9CAEN